MPSSLSQYNLFSTSSLFTWKTRHIIVLIYALQSSFMWKFQMYKLKKSEWLRGEYPFDENKYINYALVTPEVVAE